MGALVRDCMTLRRTVFCTSQGQTHDSNHTRGLWFTSSQPPACSGGVLRNLSGAWRRSCLHCFRPSITFSPWAFARLVNLLLWAILRGGSGGKRFVLFASPALLACGPEKKSFARSAVWAQPVGSVATTPEAEPPGLCPLSAGGLASDHDQGSLHPA